METYVIYCEDNLETLPKSVDADSVDVIYIDPPFKHEPAIRGVLGRRSRVRLSETVVDLRWRGSDERKSAWDDR